MLAIMVLVSIQTAAPQWTPGQVFDGVSEAVHSEDRVLLSGTGEAVVLVRATGGWAEEDTLLPGKPISALGYTDDFPSAAALQDDLAVVGASFDDFGHGAAYVYRRNGSDWLEESKLTPTTPYSLAFQDAYGTAVVIAPDETVLIGCPENSHTSAGRGYVSLVQRSNTGVWREKGRLAPSKFEIEEFGECLSLSGDTLAVGAPGAYSTGMVRVFRGGGLSWTKEQTILPSDGQSDDRFGTTVALDGDRLLVGATSADGPAGSNVGAVYVYERSGTTWTEVAKLSSADGLAHDYFGSPLRLNGDLAVVGSFQHAHPGGLSMGAVFLFTHDSTGWTQVDELQSGTPTSSFGHGSTWIEGDLWIGGKSQSFDSELTIYEPDGAASYCTAGVSASGCSAILSATGSASASQPTGFTVSAASVEGTSNGFFFFGVNGRQAKPWGSGSSFHCVAQPTRRGGLMIGAGTSSGCDGSFQQDLNAHWCESCPKPHHNPGPGTYVQVQLWYRDPQSTAWPKTGLSDALETLTLP